MDQPSSELPAGAATPPPPEDQSPHQNVEQVLKQLIEAVGDLSIVARTLERWPVYAPPIGVSQEREALERSKFEKSEIKGKQRVAEHLRRFMRKSRRIGEIVSPTFDHTNFPQDLINHIDAHLSPNLWLRGLVTEVQYANDVTRGELVALGSLHATLMFYIRTISDMSKGKVVVSNQAEQPERREEDAMADAPPPPTPQAPEATVVVPDFSLPFKSPTILRPPVIYDESKLEITVPHVIRLLTQPICPYELTQDPKDRVQIRKEPSVDEIVDEGAESARADEATPLISGDGKDMSDEPMP